MISLLSPYLSPYTANIGLLAKWAKRNYVSDIITTSCDPDTGECVGRVRRGWASNHFPAGSGATAWSTAQTLIYLARSRSFTRELLSESVLNEFGGEKCRAPKGDWGLWEQLIDSGVGVEGEVRIKEEVAWMYNNTHSSLHSFPAEAEEGRRGTGAQTPF